MTRYVALWGLFMGMWLLGYLAGRSFRHQATGQTDDAWWIERLRSEVRIAYGAGWQAGYDAALAEQEELAHGTPEMN